MNFNWPRRRVSAEGFSLVELAIVIVIIGLILSSVLVGQDIIRAAELRAVTTDINNTKTAVQTFVAKYGNKMPGDIKDPDNYNLPDCTGSNGDGLIQDGAGGRTVLSGEVLCFWQQLGSSDVNTPTKKSAELISGTYNGNTGTVAVGSHLPKVRGKTTGLGVFTDGLDNYIVAGVMPGTSASYDTAATFSPEDGKSIDEKIDDGNPLTGLVQGRDASTGDPFKTLDNTLVAASNCFQADDATPDNDDKYKVPNETPQCALFFKMPQL